jgi:hypothetical protein
MGITVWAIKRDALLQRLFKYTLRDRIAPRSGRAWVRVI